MVDNVIKGKNRAYREYASYYTESEPILDYMVSKLEISEHDSILEPCAGEGVFIDMILEKKKGVKFDIHAVDLNESAVEKLNAKYRSQKDIRIERKDTLLDITFDLLANAGGYYSKVIGNPPYGAWLSPEVRKLLKNKYQDYSKETYTLFINRCFSLLKEQGTLVFIVPDTFLALNMHKKLRRLLLANTSIQEILLIPSKFFPGVNFGYSNLCIITFTKQKPTNAHKVKIVSVKKDVNILHELANNDYSKVDSIYEQLQGDILTSPNSAFLLDAGEKTRNLILKSNLRISDIADCVTGFYSGDNSKFIKAKTEISLDEIFLDNPTRDIINGLNSNHKYLPIHKGKGFIKKDLDNFILWSKEAVQHYKTDAKARFQNSQYYFQKGIGIPMVKSSVIEAFSLDNYLFDQSVVGIFPKQIALYEYLLVFLNSRVFNKLINVINHTSNNSANYIKSIPFIIDDKGVETARILIKNYVSGEISKDELKEEIDGYFNGLYSL